jgi:putative thiamine transport system permease protein
MAAALRPLMGQLMTGFRWMSLAPTLTLLLFAGPVTAGLLGTLAPAFGWWPALGGTQVGLDAWRALAAVPGLLTASQLSLWVGLGATLLALGAAVGLAAALEGTVWQHRLEPLLSLLLATPHGAFAVGVLFLASPSGWLVRLFSPWATGWAEPPDLMLVNDPQGAALLLALAAKECFFLLLMLQAARQQVPVAERWRLARTLGYGRFTGWFKTVLPALYPQIRLPVLAALAFGLSVVDMAIVLGPATPPPLALLILDLLGDPDLTHRFTAAAAALLLVGLVLAAIAIWCAGERLVGALGRHWAATGRRRDAELAGQALAMMGFVAAAAIGLSLLLLALWSVAGAWRYPDALP